MADFISTRVETPSLLTPLTSEKRKDSWDILDRQQNAAAPFRSLIRLQSVQTTVRTLQLDHTDVTWAVVSYVVAFVLLIVVPVCKLLLVKSSTVIPTRQVVFQPVVVVIGVSRSVVSFVFLSQAIRKHGLHGVLFLDSVAEEVAQVRKDYDTVVERGSEMLVKLFVPSFVLYVGQSIWLYSMVELQPLPFGLNNKYLDIAIIAVTTCLSWMFQTTTYLYACVLFWKVCKLQELKMRQYYEMLLQGLEAEYYVLEYDRIKKDLSDTSHRFRHFLAFTGVISISGALISMYEVVNAFADGFFVCLWGNLFGLLANSVVGISVYGFILDRFFVHTSVGALLTTTWFILGRSLHG